MCSGRISAQIFSRRKVVAVLLLPLAGSCVESEQVANVVLLAQAHGAADFLLGQFDAVSLERGAEGMDWCQAAVIDGGASPVEDDESDGCRGAVRVRVHWGAR